VIVANNSATPLSGIAQDGTPNQPTIAAVMISQADGVTVKAKLPAVIATVDVSQPLNRDGDLDSGIIAHEYMHGISRRLTGGPSTSGCLANAEQAGEGWSDFMALVLTAKPTQTGPTSRPFASYVMFGGGIRSYPYTTEMSVNPQTYASISGQLAHGVGEVWAETLWEMYWNLVDEYGFNPNILDSYTQGGNNLALQLVMDGLKLQPCSPGFVDSRNAILLADQNLTGGVNQCLIWRAVAKRGLGQNANQGSPHSTFDGTQDFTVPATACRPVATADPASLSSTLVRGGSETKTLNVKSTGVAGATGDLNWTMSEALTDCATPTDLGWVSESPVSGATAQGSSTPVTVTFDSTGLTPGQTHTGRLCLSNDDAAQPPVSIPLSLLVQYPFTGFFGGIKNPSALNPANAGSNTSLQFSLLGDWGLDVFAAEYPKSQRIDCTTRAPIGAASSTTTPTGNPFSYDATLNRYTYAWKTTKSYSGTCRQFILQLMDTSTPHIVHFKFS
jgi:Fungalysin metallopeptidase (M36)